MLRDLNLKKIRGDHMDRNDCTLMTSISNRVNSWGKYDNMANKNVDI